EYFKLNLSSPANANIGRPATTTVTIVFTTAPLTVQFSASNYTVGEGAGNANLAVTLNHAPTIPITVPYATSNISATAGKSYTGVTGSLTFQPGDPLSQTIQVPITPDGIAQPDQT